MFTYPISKWQGGIFYEHAHRLLASFIGFLTVVLAIWIWVTDRRPVMRVLGVLAVLAVITQGVLGGMTVLYQLPAWISASHGILGQTFFSLTIVIAYLLSSEGRNQSQVQVQDSKVSLVCKSTARFALILVGVVYIQLIFAAAMRHTYSGLAVPDFPTMGGRWIPSLDATMIESAFSAPPVIFHSPSCRA